MKNRKKKWIRALSAGLFAICLTGTVAVAAEVQQDIPGNVIDRNRTGSIMIRYQDKEDDSSPVTGAVFSYYRIGGITDQSGDGIEEKIEALIPGLTVDAKTNASDIQKTVISYYTKKDREQKAGSSASGGKDSKEPLYRGEDIPVEDAEKTVGDSASTEPLAHYRAVTGSDGECRTAGMKQGLYLAVEEKAADGHLCSAPFLFSLPYSGAASGEETGVSNSRWYYDVIAEPKPRLEGKPEISKTVTPTVRPKQEMAGTPKTGDRAQALLYFSLLVSSFAACVMIQNYRRKGGEKI
uniref:prealbumin-like fold domain-containing protein n=1 Tax=Eubacterium cellulosolvens TaxID=29322 RepID=UPI0004845305|nr:prealbumin-like fold domain-containing protein [[Eubacterium] cellulosolvens]